MCVYVCVYVYVYVSVWGQKRRAESHPDDDGAGGQRP